MATARLETVAGETRESEGYATVRIVEDEREIWSEVRYLQTLDGVVPDPDEDTLARRAQIEAQIEAYADRDRTDDDEASIVEVNALIGSLREELDRLDNPGDSD